MMKDVIDLPNKGDHLRAEWGQSVAKAINGIRTGSTLVTINGNPKPQRFNENPFDSIYLGEGKYSVYLPEGCVCIEGKSYGTDSLLGAVQTAKLYNQFGLGNDVYELNPKYGTIPGDGSDFTVWLCTYQISSKASPDTSSDASDPDPNAQGGNGSASNGTQTGSEALSTEGDEDVEYINAACLWASPEGSSGDEGGGDSIYNQPGQEQSGKLGDTGSTDLDGPKTDGDIGKPVSHELENNNPNKDDNPGIGEDKDDVNKDSNKDGNGNGKTDEPEEDKGVVLKPVNADDYLQDEKYVNKIFYPVIRVRSGVVSNLQKGRFVYGGGCIYGETFEDNGTFCVKRDSKGNITFDNLFYRQGTFLVTIKDAITIPAGYTGYVYILATSSVVDGRFEVSAKLQKGDDLGSITDLSKNIDKSVGLLYRFDAGRVVCDFRVGITLAGLDTFSTEQSEEE